VVERDAYEPYGQVTYLTPSWGSQSGSTVAWVYLFQGGRRDSATRNYQFQRRDYSATQARWEEADPTGLGAGDVNLYRMEANNPTNDNDPTGLQPAFAKRALDTWSVIGVSEILSQSQRGRDAINTLNDPAKNIVVYPIDRIYKRIRRRPDPDTTFGPWKK